ncbi:MAG TPA: DUF1326 domain-containing protein [Dehalococcoidia bacterium]|nr:DUF1326 domain-containing protein [Dehalococcoidia bacterium]
MPWQISGQYVETCNCDFVCPCVLTLMTQTTHGYCTFAMGYSIDRGSFDDTDLAGVKFVVVGHTPGNMNLGNWDVGLIVDSAASDKQREAVVTIASGQAGGPMGALAALIANFKGVEVRPVRIEGSGSNWTVSVPDMVEEGVAGQAGMSGETLHLVNTGHPAADRLGLAHSTGTRINAFGITYEEMSGRNNGYFAPFDWRG